MNQNAEVFGAVLRALAPTRRDIVVSSIISLIITSLAIYGALHLAGAI